MKSTWEGFLDSILSRCLWFWGRKLEPSWEGKSSQDRTRQGKTGQDKTRQRQDKTLADKEREGTFCARGWVGGRPALRGIPPLLLPGGGDPPKPKMGYCCGCGGVGLYIKENNSPSRTYDTQSCTSDCLKHDIEYDI